MTLNFNYDMTKEFIAALTGDAETPLFYQHIYPAAKDPERSKTSTGNRRLPFSQVKDWLTGRQKNNGDGVFVCVNYIPDGTPLSKKENGGKEVVSKIHAVWVDIDGDYPMPAEWALKPSITVRSSGPNNWHAYWLVDDVAPHEFADMQKRLYTNFKSDKTVINTNRIMRLPGFYHTKNDMILTEMLSCDPNLRYTKADLVAAYPVDDNLLSSRSALMITDIGTRKALRTYAEWALAKDTDQGSRHKTLIAIAGEGHLQHGFSDDEVYSVCMAYAEASGLAADRDAHKEILDIMDWVKDGPLGYMPQLIDIYLEERLDNLADELAKDSAILYTDDISFIAKVSDSELNNFTSKLMKDKLPIRTVNELKRIHKDARANLAKALKRKQQAKAKQEGLTILDDATDFTAIAEALRSSQFRQSKLIYFNGGYYCYNGKHYESRSEKWIEHILYKWLERAVVNTDKGLTPFKPNIQSVANVRKALEAKCYYEGSFPTWRGSGRPKGSLICFSNGILSLETDELHPHSSKFFSTYLQNYDYDPTAACPLFLKTLDQWFPNDTASKTTLKRMLGYLISGDNKRQKLFVLAGVPRSGKSSIAALIEQLMPATVATSYDQLGSRFGLNNLISASVAILGDAKLGRNSNKSLITERLKQISGGDLVEIEPKNKDIISARLNCRFVIVTNDVISLGDASGAMNRRMVPVRFSESFYGKEDRTLGDRMAVELSGIANWALEGLKELNSAKAGEEWLYSRDTEDYMRSLVEAGSPVEIFADECLGHGGEVGTAELYDAFKVWAEEEGYFILSRNRFLADLNSSGNWKIQRMKIDAGEHGRALGSVGAERPSDSSNDRRPKRIQGVRGVHLKGKRSNSGDSESGFKGGSGVVVGQNEAGSESAGGQNMDGSESVGGQNEAVDHEKKVDAIHEKSGRKVDEDGFPV